MLQRTTTFGSILAPAMCGICRSTAETVSCVLSLNGWTLSQTFFRRTGYPFSITDSVTASNLYANNAIGSILAYPSSVGPLPTDCGGPQVKAGLITPCFTPDLFLPGGAAPGFGGTGRLQRVESPELRESGLRPRQPQPIRNSYADCFTAYDSLRRICGSR